MFSLKITTSGTTVEFKYLGYKTKTMKITQKGTVDLGTVSMEADSHVLNDVVVTSSIAVARKTPVAVSSVAMDFIEEKLGTQEFPEILKSTPVCMPIKMVVVTVTLKSICVDSVMRILL